MPFIIQPLRPGEEHQASRLVHSVFTEYIAGDYTPEGIIHFLSYISPASFQRRMQTDNFFQLAAWLDRQLVGIIEIRDWSHICLLFVDQNCHGQGLARQLLDQALQHCQAAGKLPRLVTVKASPYAFSAGIYGRLGFVQTEDEQEQNGISFIPMAKHLA